MRHAVADDVHEVECSLSLVAAMGFPPPPDDDGRLRLRRSGVLPVALAGFASDAVVHCGASVPARTWSSPTRQEAGGGADLASVAAAARTLRERWAADGVVVTMGEQGASWSPPARCRWRRRRRDIHLGGGRRARTSLVGG